MRGLRVSIATGLCGIAALLATSAWAGDKSGDSSGAVTAAPVPALAKASQHWGMLEKYCEECHNYKDWKGQIAFDTMVPEEVPQDAKTWEAALRKLRGRMMPPPGKPHPDEATRESFIHWVESYLDEAAERHPDPGYVALHRLNRKEYANAIHDLLALDIDAPALLPKDDISDGFDNVADVLQVTPSFIEQYISAARTVALEAVGQPDPQPSSKTYRADPDTTQQEHIEGLPLGTRGGLQVTHMFPADGNYVISIGNMAVALWVYNMEFKNHLIVTLDGKKVYETTIGGDPDMKNIDQKQDPAVDAINARLKNIKFKATAGPHKVAVTFVQRDFAESDDRLQLLVPGGGQDQILRIRSFEIRGPYKPTGLSATPSREKIFLCHPENAAAEEPCAQKILANLARRAYRRPVGDSDMAELMKFYQSGYKLGGFEAGVRMGLTGILSNPDFLYRPEPAPAGTKPGQAFHLTDLEIASRLSFFLWSTIPDDELLTVASENKLHDPKVLAAEVKRMLASPKADTLADNFAYQWLELAKLDEVDPDPAIFPYASGAGDPREDFKKETTMFVNSIFREDHSVLDLLTANYTYLNEKVALLYGITDVKGDRFQRVNLKDPVRWGLLGKGAILMASSYPNRTAPVLRGEWIMDNITGTPPTPPPPNVKALKENVAGATALTVRERMAQHRTDPSCNACHGILDPLGLALDNFSAVGEWRTKDRFAGTPIDATGVLPDGSPINGPIDLRNALMKHPDQFVQTFVQKLMTYGLGRTLDYRDMPTVRRIVHETAADNYKFSSIVMAIVNSDQFQMNEVPIDSGTKTAKDAVKEASAH